MKIALIFIISGLLLSYSVTTNAQTRICRTKVISGAAPEIDGYCDELIWNSVEWSGDFTQRDPNDGAPASQNTAFKILADNNNLYLLIRAYDSVPSAIVNRLSRRDKDDGDWLAVSIDSYADKQAVRFTRSSRASTQRW